ncbi:GGDEF domain-containing protein [Solidesulfovibrio sp.]
MASLQDESLEEMRVRLERVRDDPARVAALAGEFLDLAGRMAAKAEKLARIGDRTQARMVELNRRLRQQEEQYRGIFENSTEGIFLADAAGALLAANPALLELLAPGDAGPASGLPREAVAVASLFFDAADYQAFARTLAETGRVQRLEVRVKTPRGPVWCLVGASRIEPDGHVVGMTQDITARKALEEELVHRAASDVLTGLANRRGFFENAARALGAAARSGAPLGLIMLDVDHFKAVNDTFGHEVGDAVLRAVAGRLRDSVRVSDSVGRVGGEEFAVLCPGTDRGGAAELAERLRRAVEALVVETAGRPIRVTASFGVALWDAALDQDAADCLARADRALYAAKRSGRNRVCLDGPAPPPGTDA